MMNNTHNPRPSIIPSGKYHGCLIANLSVEELIAMRGEFRFVNDPVHGAIQAELSRREKVRRGRNLATRSR